ncbi:MAG: hypothetical protein BVN33_17440 [Proteobacteria bacterium ST_bin13]|nr:MAG: hypothetical protein BVN33_17440 [Proteobacteria bacterium ST_bin13]
MNEIWRLALLHGLERKRGCRSAVSQGIKREQVVAAMTHRAGTRGTQDARDKIGARWSAYNDRRPISFGWLTPIEYSAAVAAKIAAE